VPSVTIPREGEAVHRSTPAPEQRKVQAVGVSRPAGSASRLIALQRVAGNAAVALAVQRLRIGSSHVERHDVLRELDARAYQRPAGFSAALAKAGSASFGSWESLIQWLDEAAADRDFPGKYLVQGPTHDYEHGKPSGGFPGPGSAGTFRPGRS
jgi:hypothetical protein